MWMKLPCACSCAWPSKMRRHLLPRPPIRAPAPGCRSSTDGWMHAEPAQRIEVASPTVWRSGLRPGVVQVRETKCARSLLRDRARAGPTRPARLRAAGTARRRADARSGGSPGRNAAPRSALPAAASSATSLAHRPQLLPLAVDAVQYLRNPRMQPPPSVPYRHRPAHRSRPAGACCLQCREHRRTHQHVAVMAQLDDQGAADLGQGDGGICHGCHSARLARGSHG
jgi:hypothetical protein